MQVSSMFSDKKNLIIELVVLIAFLGALYFGYTLFKTETPTLAQGAHTALMGPNLTLIVKAVHEERLSFKDFSFMETELVGRLRDFSETIVPNDSRGRDDPFTSR